MQCGVIGGVTSLGHRRPATPAMAHSAKAKPLFSPNRDITAASAACASAAP